MVFAGKTVIITGGAQGIGKAIVSAYAKEGATVVIADVNEQKGKETAEEYGATFIKTDVKNHKDVIKLIETVKHTTGRIDIVINNAGVSRFKSLYELTVEEWDDILQTNLRSVFLFAKESAKYMRENERGGSIINIASTRAFMSEKDSEAYAASKGGIVALTHALAISLGEDKIKVNCISPGWIETNNYELLTERDHLQHPAKRVGKPDDIARACLFLTHPDNDFITGENIIIDGGMTKKMIYEE